MELVWGMMGYHGARDSPVGGLFSATIFVKLAAKDLRHKHILKCVPLPKNWMVKRPHCHIYIYIYIYAIYIYAIYMPYIIRPPHPKCAGPRWSKGCDIKV
jgi:hypothetical protein